MAPNTGFLVPPNYVPDLPNDDEMNIASIIWGLSLGVTVFNAAKAFRQSKSAIQRRKRLTAYVCLIWAEIISSFLLGIMTWLYLRGIIGPSFQFFFFIIVWWSTQVQCLIQIIINRVGLLMVIRSNATKLKWLCFLILLSVNISVFCVWVPARLQISDTFVHINEIWDRCEKVIFAIMDAALNFYFIYVVKKRLISNGLQKYNRLYQMNLILVAISIALDILLIAMMSLPNGFVYVQFHPLVYLLKLHIEMNMADLIGKVVRASNNQDGTHDYSSRSRTGQTGSRPHPGRFGHTLTSAHHRTHIELGDDDEMELKERENLEGIKKTVVTEIIRSGPNGEDDDVPELHERAVSEASSTKQLHGRTYSIDHAH
ncbi:Fc.00g002470.m01.CDS01 [Cosmosporella sp. VM-42]